MQRVGGGDMRLRLEVEIPEYGDIGKEAKVLLLSAGINRTGITIVDPARRQLDVDLVNVEDITEEVLT